MDLVMTEPVEISWMEVYTRRLAQRRFYFAELCLRYAMMTLRSSALST